MAKKLLSYLALFTSLSTLVCCALPALFVGLGFGATLVTILSSVPQLIILSEHKTMVFTVAGILLVAAGLMNRSSRQQACPADTELGAACTDAKSAGRKILYVSAGVYFIGGFFAYVAPQLF